MQVKDIMSKDPITVTVGTNVHALAELLVEKNISGAPVVDDDGILLGIVQEEGVIFQDKKVHLPTFLHISLGFLTLGVKQYEEEIRKVTATKVDDIMEKDIVVLSPEMSVEDVATIMIEKASYYCPVVEEDKLIGVITKKDIVRSIARD
ncbi:MAG: CBS domain-containing protein [Candidatus Susulua stagnicola]|nr:CBS domain-containing protein [Candidatus Susulua stagnicola]